MPIKVTMPALSPTMTEGTLAKWIKKEGDDVSAGDVIAEIETDKATMEVEAVDEGKLGKILVKEGTEGVPVNELIAVLLEEGEDDGVIDPFLKQGANDGAPKQSSDVSDQSSEKKEKAASQNQASGSRSPITDNRVIASPLAKRIANDRNIDLSQITGSGPKGRIVKADVEKELKNSRVAAGSSAPRQIASGPDARALADAYGMAYEEIKNSGVRKVIANRLLESKQTIPHFYLTVECRIDPLLAARKQINAAANGAYKLSVNDFVIKAVAQALKDYPAANVAWTEQSILQFKNSDISVAVATDNGLITPIIKKAEEKSLRDISDEMKALAAKAREGKLKPEEFQGGTFSISNLGMYGIDEFSAIINPPQSCILAVGAGKEKPCVENGQVSVGTFMKCTLSTDHRSVDGAVGAEFLQVFQRYIEAPITLFV